MNSNYIKNFTNFILEYNESSNNISTDSSVMIDILRNCGLLKYIDRATGHFYQSIDIILRDINYKDELIGILNDNNWYIERAHSNSITISKKYISESKVSIIPRLLYHLTPSINVENILNVGLLAKSEDIRHRYPPRIYVSDNISTLVSLSKEFKRWKGNSEYSIIEINTNGLNLNLYMDLSSAYKGHLYTQDIDYIPPSNIKLYKNL